MCEEGPLWRREKLGPGAQASDTSLDTLYADVRDGRGRLWRSCRAEAQGGEAPHLWRVERGGKCMSERR